MVTLAQDGPAAFRDRFELVHRHRVEAPNATWQADHTMLDLLILDEGGNPARSWPPWWTTTPAPSPDTACSLAHPAC